MSRPLSGPEISVGLEGLRKRDIPHMPKEICQMILYKKYRLTTNPLRNTFGQGVVNLRSEIKTLVKQNIKKTTTKKKILLKRHLILNQQLLKKKILPLMVMKDPKPTRR